MHLGGPPTRTRCRGYHLARPGGPPGAERRLVPAKSNLKPQTAYHQYQMPEVQNCYTKAVENSDMPTPLRSYDKWVEKLHQWLGRCDPAYSKTNEARLILSCVAGAGSPRRQRPHPGHTGRGTLAARSRGRAAGGGTAPDTTRPSQRWKAPPPGTPFRHANSEQRRPARAHAVGPVLGPHARTDRTRDTRDAEPWLPAPEGGRPGEGQRLTPGAPHNGGRHPPRGRPSATPTASNAGPQGRTPWGRCWVRTPAPTAPGTHGTRNPGCPLQRTGGRERDSA